MTRVRHLDDLLEKNRTRHLGTARTRSGLTGRDGLPLRARRTPRSRESFAVQVARGLVVIAVGVLVIGLWQHQVQKIVVEGLVLGPVERVHEACAPLLGQRWLTIDTAAAAVRLRTEPWFEHVEFERRAPASVVVRLSEAQPLFRVQIEDRRLAVDAHGCLLPYADSLDLDALPLLRGVAVEHDALRAVDRARVHDFVVALGQAPWPWEGGLAAVELREPHVTELTTRGGVLLRLDDRDLVAQLRAADAAWGRLSLAPGDRLDLRFRRQVVLARAASAAHGG